ncbi:MAG: hypothetical protein ABIR17_04780 [Pseudolysinimonas sp.]|uniref:hypothetical protein n=1 Tax=Pseudolysinimonas sp. TaxID=2680009 RepID=UPI00326527BD
MFRTPTLLRATIAVAVGLSAATLLSGCFSPVAIGGATPRPTSTGFASVGGDTPEPIDTGNQVDPTAAPTAGYVSVQDDLKVLAVAVPVAWTDIDTAPFDDNGGQQWASIAAATNLDDYFAGWSASGVEVGAAPLNPDLTDADLTTFLESISDYLTKACTVDEDAGTYSDPYYAGFESIFEDCGGAGSGVEGFAIVAVNTDRTHVIYVRGQIADAAEDPSDIFSNITNSFQATI